MNPSPAERYAKARKSAESATTPFGTFQAGYAFELDDFQIRACEALSQGRGVLVAAPTGSGKTVVGEFAIHLALATGRKAFYTTPIKALSNQKYADLVRRYGADSVGLLTGDNTVNGEAPVVVMTTEVLRNMLYADSATLNGLGYVVMDEVHYLADRFRGAVWEEVIIHLPDDVALVSLSATVSNAEEFGDWLEAVRGDTEVVVSEHRPVPLWQHVLHHSRLFDLFAEPDDDVHQPARGRKKPGAAGDSPEPPAQVNPELRRALRDARSREVPGRRGQNERRGRPPRGQRPPSRAETISILNEAGLLPAISFIFSRAGCDAAVRQCLAAGIRLTSPEERDQIRAIVDARCADIPDEDLAVLGYWDFADALERGIASHHAGLLPTFKEVVEELFTAGLVRIVFATETLALGINMPARSVVLEKLVKWNGETHADVTPGEYTQLTGRAGRRGIDTDGHAIVIWQQGLDADAVSGLASTRTYPLRSSFRPTYNMAVNLVSSVGRSRAREILETSFAQFQADRAVVGLARQARKQEEALDGYAEAMRCHLGDFTEYASLRRKISDRESALSRSATADRRNAALESLEALRRGDVIRVPGGRRAGWAVVLDPGPAGGADGPRPTVLTVERQVRRLSLVDVPSPIEPVTRIVVPKHFSSRSPAARRDLASTVRNALGVLQHDEDGTPPTRRNAGPRRDRSAEDGELNQLRRAMRAHPCHGCDEREEHARWAQRWYRLNRETQSLTRRIEGRTNSIARVFDRVCDLLSERGYLNNDRVTPEGERLRQLYAESDLLVAECLRYRVWDDLDPAGFAAVVSALVYQARRDDRPAPRVPSALRPALAEIDRIWSGIDDRERDLSLNPTPAPDAGIVWAMHRWAKGHSLQAVLADDDIAAGDFVRWCKQVIDLLGQISTAAERGGLPETAATARAACDAVRRGVVAYSSLG